MVSFHGIYYSICEFHMIAVFLSMYTYSVHVRSESSVSCGVIGTATEYWSPGEAISSRVLGLISWQYSVSVCITWDPDHLLLDSWRRLG